MRSRVSVLLPLLAILVAAAPGVHGLLARDGKAKAIEAGHIRVERAQQQAVEEALAQRSSAQAAPLPGADCANGFAGPYPCENVDLLSIVPIPEIGAAVGSDVWGWTDPETGREIVITTTTFGAAFVDVTDPSAPVVLGRIQQAQEDSGVLWRDVKVYENHAYLVSEHAAGNLIVFDLTQLREVTSDQGFLEPTTVYTEFGNAHNIAINEETGFAYVVGSDTCEAGLHMIDLSSPAEPTFAGCFAEDGYTHDVQCVIYEGPDAAFRGHEICFAANEDTITIVDVTDKSNPVMLSRTGYDTAGYTHQGWLTADHEWFVFGDELDEDGPLTSSDQPVSNTATYMMKVDDLRSPGAVQTFLHETTAIDHNLYIDDGYIWQANYMAGLRVMDYTEESLASGELTQVAHFDVDPGPDEFAFAGAWTAYPFFESGTIALNSFDSGLFLLRADLPEKAPVEPAPAEDDGSQGAPSGQDERTQETAANASNLPATGGGAAAAVLGLALVGGAVWLRRGR